MTTAQLLESIVQKERDAATQTMRKRLRTLQAQRDQANGRCKELRERITQYQKTIAKLRDQIRAKGTA